MFALFNKDKKFIGYSPDVSKNPNISPFYKEIPHQYRDISQWHWEGDFDTGGMVSNKKIIELTKDQKILAKLHETYSLGTQIVNIVKQLDILSKNANLYDSDFKDMKTKMMEIICSFDK